MHSFKRNTTTWRTDGRTDFRNGKPRSRCSMRDKNIGLNACSHLRQMSATVCRQHQKQRFVGGISRKVGRHFWRLTNHCMRHRGQPRLPAIARTSQTITATSDWQVDHKKIVGDIFRQQMSPTVDGKCEQPVNL